MSNIHTFDNGIQVYKHHLTKPQLKRYAKCNLHEPDEEKFFLDCLSKMPQGSTLLNVGSAIGYYCILAKKTRPDLTVIGVNPHRMFVKWMKANMILNQQNDIQIEQSAVTKKSGMKMFLGNGYGSGVEMKKSNTQQAVQTITLDDMFAKYNIQGPVFIQMDIQGAEQGVLRSMTANVWEKVSFILVGTHSVSIHNNCKQVLVRNNLRILHDENLQQTTTQPDGILLASK